MLSQSSKQRFDERATRNAELKIRAWHVDRAAVTLDDLRDGHRSLERLFTQQTLRDVGLGKGGGQRSRVGDGPLSGEWSLLSIRERRNEQTGRDGRLYPGSWSEWEQRA